MTSPQQRAELKTTVTKIDQLRTDIDAIVAEIDLPAGRRAEVAV